MRKPTRSGLASLAIGFVLFCSLGDVADAQRLDETWCVTANGRSVQVNPDGSFSIPNIPAPDAFGASGPGSVPDFLSDDFLRVTGVSTAGGVTRYMFSEPFRLNQGQSFLVENFIVSTTPPPIPVSLDVSVPSTVLMVGETAQVLVEAVLGDGTIQDVTASGVTTYRTSSPSRIGITSTGLITANSAGLAAVTVVNEGVSSVLRIEAAALVTETTIEGFVQLDDGTPVADADVSISFGQAITTDADGLFSAPIIVPAGSETLEVSVSASILGVSFAGDSGPVPILVNGITDAGIIEVDVSVLGPTVTIGYPGTGGNSFPFGSAGSRYQQVYNSALFPGPLFIDNISFFNERIPGGSIDDATYTIYLSTTSKLVNQLDTVNFDDNVGSDNALFLSTALGGPLLGARLTLEGQSFFYDPSQGNLLVDIFKGTSFGGGTIFLDARNGSFGTDSSRAHNFGQLFASWGLVTEFNAIVTTPASTGEIGLPEGSEAGPDGAHIQSE